MELLFFESGMIRAIAQALKVPYQICSGGYSLRFPNRDIYIIAAHEQEHAIAIEVWAYGGRGTRMGTLLITLDFANPSTSPEKIVEVIKKHQNGS